MADDEVAGAAIRAAFDIQTDWARRMGAPITERIVAALPAALDRGTATARAVLDWPGDPVADALVLRLLGGLHALHRAGGDAALSRVFGGEERDPETVASVLRETIVARDAALLPWLDGPPQTNEVGRSAALMTGLLHLAQRFGPRLEVLEMGSSAGLNLMIAEYGIDLGEVRVGPVEPALVLTPQWRGPLPPDVPIEIVSARGVDVAPIDLADPVEAARLQAYVWVDDAARQERLARAIDLVRRRGVALDRGDAADWLAARLAEPQAVGVTRVVMHSVVWQYLPAATRERVTALIEAAGARATDDRPLGWVAMEPSRGADWFEVRVRSWPGGEAMVVAHTHPHAAWIEGVA